MARILLVDDDALLRETVHQMLALDGHQVTEAEDGHEGLNQIQRGLTVDLVITDVLMPFVDGAQFIVELKKHRPHLPVIAISGGRRLLSQQFSLDSAKIAGASHVLPKPFGRPALQNAVKTVLQSSPPVPKTSL